MPEKPTVELFLKNIQAEQGRSPRGGSGGRGRGQSRGEFNFPWSNDWSFPWSQDWWDDWWNPWNNDFAGASSSRCSVSSLLVRKEPVGAVIYNSATKAVYKINDVGCQLILALQSGESFEAVSDKLGLSPEDINQFLSQILR